jgi:Lon-like protease
MLKQSRLVKVCLLIVVLVAACTFITLPYYVSTPGSAQELKPFVQVEGGDQDEGDLMLVTISMGKANVFRYLSTFFNKYNHLYTEEEIVGKDGSHEEYNYRQDYMMKTSQNAAVAVAYNKAGKKVEYIHNGVVIFHVVEGMPAYGKLKLGDKIKKVDGQEMKTAQTFIDYVGSKKAGETITITYDREKKEETISLTLQTMKDDPKRAGIGVSIGDDRTLKVDPTIKIDAKEIGGPSAGMMFTLEIYNQLVPEDITKGHRIAGTGTINEKGEVGPIGGADQKLLAAEKAGATVFFAPAIKPEVEGKSNYDEAVAAAKDTGAKIEVVPVNTLDDALNYLEALPEK